MNKATEAKSAIEDGQREDAQEREKQGIMWKPKFFALHTDRYIPMLGSLPEEYRRRRLGTAHAKLPGRVDGHKANARRHCAVRKIGTPPDTKNKRETNAVSRLLSLAGTSSL